MWLYGATETELAHLLLELSQFGASKKSYQKPCTPLYHVLLSLYTMVKF